MIGVVVPAHNEEACIAACLESVQLAARHPALNDEGVMLVVALDACSDRTGSIARGLGARTVSLSSHNVGRARAVGASAALETGARWLACTDADSTVATDRALGAGSFCRDRRFVAPAADLPVFIRQSHGERDFAALGERVIDTKVSDQSPRQL